MIGEPLNRVDGPLKVSGRATYAYEHSEATAPLYGFIVGATIARGRITAIDGARAERAPGVRAVLTHRNVPAQGRRDMAIRWEFWRAFPVLGPEIHSYGEAAALVVAGTFEQAQAAANLVQIEYAGEPGRFDLVTEEAHAYAPEHTNAGLETDTAVGDFDAAFNGAEVKFDQQFESPLYLSMPMEPNACIAVPRGEDLIVYVSTQIVDAARSRIASTLQMDPRRVKIVSPYVGGGFGSKLAVHAEAILAALAARQLQQPVKVAMSRRQIFHLAGVRPVQRQRIRLAAGRDGRLAALGHEVTLHTNPSLEYAEQTAATSRSLYAAPNRITRHRLVPMDLLRGEDVRAPGEAPGMLATESAMDELAEALQIDPVELRIRNEPSVDPERGVPFSERRLVECLREGARRFGWERRPAQPASVREGRWLIGYGVASAIRMHFQSPNKVRVRIGPDGIAVVESDMTDIGTGTYTILTQVAAESLGLPVEQVRVELGCSDYPAGAGSGGSWGAANSTVAVYRACEALRQKLLAEARSDPRSPLHGRHGNGAAFADGRVAFGGASEPVREIVARKHPQGLVAESDGPSGMRDDPNYRSHSIHTYGAHFAEVGVDRDTAEIRLRRMLGVFCAGRALNAKTARSQLIGGMIFGLGMALLEEAVVDTRTGSIVNADLAGYLLPVHADIPELDAVLLDGFDAKANVLGAKGLGELGICGAGAAIANAVYNATGVRVRDFPITIDKVLPRLPLADGLTEGVTR